MKKETELAHLSTKHSVNTSIDFFFYKKVHSLLEAMIMKNK